MSPQDVSIAHPYNFQTEVSRLYDAHIHWDQYTRREQREMIRRARDAGLKGVIAAAVDLSSCRRLLEIRQEQGDFVHVALGLHPEKEHGIAAEEAVIRMIREHRGQIVAIGEVGLPWYSVPETERDCVSPAALERLGRFCRLARELDLPLVLHAVHDRAADALALLQQWKVEKAVFHWLKAPRPVAEAIVQAGYYVSVTPEVCFRQRDQELLEWVPLQQLLLETDGPWPHEGRFAGRRTEPAMIRQVAECVAALKQVSWETAWLQVADNVKRVFLHV